MSQDYLPEVWQGRYAKYSSCGNGTVIPSEEDGPDKIGEVIGEPKKGRVLIFWKQTGEIPITRTLKQDQEA